MVVDFELAYYENESENTYLRAVSTDLNKLYESFKKNPCVGEVLAIDEEVFNKLLRLRLSYENISAETGVENLGVFSVLVREYFEKNKQILASQGELCF